MPAFTWRKLDKDVSISGKLSKVSHSAALLWTWTICHCDDYGLIQGEPGDIKAIVVPRLSMTELEVDKHLKELEAVGLIGVYEGVIGCKGVYVGVENFLKYQKPGKGKKRMASKPFELLAEAGLIDKNTGNKITKRVSGGVEGCRREKREDRTEQNREEQNKASGGPLGQPARRLEQTEKKGASAVGCGMTTPAAPASENRVPLSAEEQSIQFKKIVAGLKANQNQKEGDE